ncbi:MAG: RNA polymerase sigma factor [Gemmatimonadaceae bacterium]
MRPEPPSLPVLAARAQLGDRDALEALLRALCPVLKAHIRFLMRAADDDADDVLQEVLWLIARRLGTLQDVAWVRAWSYRIASREALRSLRRSRRRHTEPLDDAAAEVPRSEPLDEPDVTIGGHLLEQLDLLPPKAQVVVRLRFLDALSQQEIAEALEIPIGTVKSRLAYGLNRLREVMGKDSAPSDASY